MAIKLGAAIFGAIFTILAVLGAMFYIGLCFKEPIVLFPLGIAVSGFLGYVLLDYAEVDKVKP